MSKLTFLLGFCVLLTRAQNSGKWGSYSSTNNREIQNIKEDVRNFQKLGICGTSRVLPNELLFQGRKRRETNEAGQKSSNFITSLICL